MTHIFFILSFLVSGCLFAQVNCVFDLPESDFPSVQLPFTLEYSENEAKELGAVWVLDSSWVLWDDDYGVYEYEEIYLEPDPSTAPKKRLEIPHLIPCLSQYLENLNPETSAFWELGRTAGPGKNEMLMVEIRQQHLGYPCSEKVLVVLDKKQEIQSARVIAAMKCDKTVAGKSGKPVPVFLKTHGRISAEFGLAIYDVMGRAKLFQIDKKGEIAEIIVTD